MDKNKKLKMLVPVLVVVLIFVWARVFESRPSRVKRKADRGIETAQFSSVEKDLAPLLAVNFYHRSGQQSSYSDWGRNPFDLPVMKTDEKIILNGILWDSQNPTVLINNRILGVGDNVGSNMIVDIKPDRVILNNGTKNFELKL